MACTEGKADLPEREKSVYTSCYCEENIWKLCASVREVAPDQLQYMHVIFISNESRQVPIWKQRASSGGRPYVLWDYHVILLYKDADSTQIYDMDTVLPYPCDFKTYVCDALGSEEGMAKRFHRSFRVISSQEYLTNFASDRSHMLKEDGSWMATPPNYDPIKTSEASNNLDDFISMDPSKGWGDVYSLQQLIEKYLAIDFRLHSLLRPLSLISPPHGDASRITCHDSGSILWMSLKGFNPFISSQVAMSMDTRTGGMV